MSDFLALVAALMANDNAARKQAEEAYAQYKSENPQALVLQLVQLLRSGENDEVRAFAPVLLRPLIEVKAGVYDKLDASAQLTLKSQLLEAVAAEPVAHIRRKIGHLLAELASVSQKFSQPWPELLAAVSALTTHADAQLRETAFDLLAKLAEYVGELLAPHKESFLALFSSALNDASAEVQVASLKAAASFLITLEERQELAAFAVLIGPMLRIIEGLLKAGDEATFREVLSMFVQVAELHPKFFRDHLEDVGRAMIFISSTQDLDADTRELAVEFLLSLAENAGGMVRKSQSIVQSVVPLVIQMMCEVEDDAAWVTKFDDPVTFTESTDAENSVSETGAAAIDRLSSSLGGAAVLPVAIPVIKTLLTAADWRQRRAALYAICLLGEGSKALMTRELDNVVAMVVPFVNDAHPRVQYAALHSLGQLAEDFGEVEKGKNFQARYHATVLPALTALIAHEQGVLRTRALAASVVINFCNTNVCKAKHVAPHAPALLEALFNALRTCPRQVQEQAITAVASVAKVVGADFARFYDIFIPLAKDVLVHASGAEFALLRGKAMESIALIGQAVGKDRFAGDAKEVMEILIRVQATEALEGPEVQYVAQSCVRIGSILKRDFVPYLPHVIPPLIQQAQIEPDIVLVDIAEGESDEADGKTADGKDSVTVDIRGVGKKRLQINTSALEEKTNACNMLYQSALDLEGAFYPYVAEVADVLIPLLSFEYVEDVRIVSALSMARLLNAAVDGTLNYGHGATAPHFPQQLFEKFLEPLLNGLQTEEDLECLGAFAEATSACLEVCKDSVAKGVLVGVPLEHVPRVVDVFKTVATSSAERMAATLQENQDDEDFDDEAAAKQGETDEVEEGVFRAMIDSIGWLIKTQKEAFFPVFKIHLLPFVTPLLELGVVNVLRGQAICMIDDVIEHCGQPAQELVPVFLTHLIAGLEDVAPAVIQASAYGIGVCAEKCGAAFAPFATNALAKLVHVVTVSAAVDDDEVRAARDNAVSAVAKILLFSEGSVESAFKLWAVWLSWLPLQTDVLEARDLHARLIALVDAGHAPLLGPEYANLPFVLTAFAAILLHEPEELDGVAGDDEEEDMAIISEEARAQLRAVLVKLQTQLPAEVVQAAWSALSGDAQQALAQV